MKDVVAVVPFELSCLAVLAVAILCRKHVILCTATNAWKWTPLKNN
jgi:hypothetical protein